MSADNTIAILKTPRKDGGFEYRVAHAQAIDNLWYAPVEWEDQNYCKDGNPKEIVRYFGDCEVFLDAKAASEKAKQLYDDCMYVEYGIQEYSFPKTFEIYQEMAALMPKYSWED